MAALLGLLRGRVADDLRPVRWQDAPDRAPPARGDRVTARAFRAALCCLTLDGRLVRCGLAQIAPRAPTADTRRQTAVAKVDATIAPRPADAPIAT